MIRRLADRFDFDLEYYLSGASLLLVDQATTLALALATTWCFTNLVPKEVYGAYGYVLAVAGMLTLIALPGVSQAIQRSAARGFDGALAAGMQMRMRGGAVAGVVMALFAVVLFAWDRPSVAGGAMVAAALFPLVYAMDDYRSVLFGKQRFGVYLGLHTMIQTLVAGATITAIVAGLPFFAILAANFAARSTGNALALVVMRRRVLTNNEVDDDFKSFGWNLSLVGVIGGISYQLDRFIVGSMLGLEVMAGYELALRLTDPLRTLGVFLNKLVFPRAVRVSGAAVARRFFLRVLPMAVMLALIGLLATVVVGPIMGWLFPKYPEAVLPTRWLIWSALAAVVLIYLETFYISQERFHRTYYVASTLRPIAIIAMLVPFIHWWGVLGAIWTKLLVRAGESVILFVKLFFDRRLLAREELTQAEPETDVPATAVPCPLCGDARAQGLWQVSDRLGRTPGSFTVVRCLSCGLVRQEPQIDEDVALSDDELYRLAIVVGDKKEQRRRRDWLNWVVSGKPGAPDIGWRRVVALLPVRLRARFGGVAAQALAWPGEGRRLLVVGGGNEFAVRMTELGWRVDQIAPDETPVDGRTYHAIYLRGALSHTRNPLDLLSSLRAALEVDGVLIALTAWLDVPPAHLAGSSWRYLDQPRARALYTRGHLASLLRIAGFHQTAGVCASAFVSRRGGWWRRLLDLIGWGDAGILVAVRDDKPVSGWAPREIRERRVR